ncbi:MAG: 50S ribosomal protein L24 [Leptospiraceae bacterium]|nr:50S ribosomal protein L24 [Leptospiraceae bacterium]MDW7975182.1 50S ribosomal protein L24 [Leptospiraceae bacterium]
MKLDRRTLQKIQKEDPKLYNKLKHKKTKLKVNDEVIVIAGKHKGKRGKILYIDRLRQRVIVQGINKIKKYVRPTQENPKGGVIEIEAPIHISNVMFYDPKLKRGVRIGYKFDEDRKVRVARGKGGGKEID